jgi:hypothetical protein
MMKARRFFPGQRQVNRTPFEMGDRPFHIVYKQRAKIAMANQDPLHALGPMVVSVRLEGRHQHVNHVGPPLTKKPRPDQAERVAGFAPLSGLLVHLGATYPLNPQVERPARV